MKLVNEMKADEMKKRKTCRLEDVRGSYYRDTTAIIHSSSFRRLKHKTQVFFSPSNDHICTRMEHSLHVASIASTICRPLSLDTELAWAIGIGHDLGHTPFGHVGERIISAIKEEEGLGIFEHETNSLRVVDFLDDRGKGLNLTYAVRDGIACHNGESISKRMHPTFALRDLDSVESREGLVPATYEGCVVRFSDSIAYLGRDYEDACRLGIVRPGDLPDEAALVLGDTNGKIIDALVNDVIETAEETGEIGFSERIYSAFQALSDFNVRRIYKSDLLEGCYAYFNRLLRLIVNYLNELFDKYGTNEEGYEKERNMLASGFGRHVKEMAEPYMEREGSLKRMVIDYAAGMTDSFALDAASEILIPEHLNVELESGSYKRKWFDAY